MHISHIMKHKISSEVCRFSYLAALIILVESVNSQLGYNEPCASSLRRTSTSEPNQCDQLRGLGCKNGMCRCLDDTQMHYNMTSEACHVYVFGNCSIPNSMGQLSCADPNAECSYWGECLCKEGFLPESMDKKALVSKEQRCLPIYPALECDKEQLPCHFNSGMECFRGRCRCPNPVSQVFENIERRNEESPQMCMGLPGMKKGCDPKSVLENNGCRLNSHCDQNGTCQCNPGHVPTPGLNPECQLAYQQDCDDVEGSGNYCNYQVGLGCFNGKCLCQDEPHVMYDEEKGACSRLEGYPCSMTIKLEDDTYSPCFTGLECTVVSKTNPLLGVCLPVSSTFSNST